MKKLFHSVTPLVGAHFPIGPRWLNYPTGLAACLSMIMPLAAWAQTPGRDPFDTRTAPASPVYESAFIDYKPYQDPEIISWKAANEVVREFGGMASMKGMGEGDSSAHDGHKSGGSEQSSPPAQPANSGSHTGQDAPAATPAVPPANSKPDDMKTMPGHDMSKMPQASPSSPAKPSPAPQPAAPARPHSMPGHGGMSH